MAEKIDISEKEYVSCGYVVNSKQKLCVEYRLLDKDDNAIANDDGLSFEKKQHTNMPVGFVLKISQKESGLYHGFQFLRKIENQQMKEFRLRSIANIKYSEISGMKNKALRMDRLIENMTLLELKEWSNKNYVNKRYLKYYLLDRF